MATRGFNVSFKTLTAVHILQSMLCMPCRVASVHVPQADFAAQAQLGRPWYYSKRSLNVECDQLML